MGLWSRACMYLCVCVRVCSDMCVGTGRIVRTESVATRCMPCRGRPRCAGICRHIFSSIHAHMHLHIQIQHPLFEIYLHAYRCMHTYARTRNHASKPLDQVAAWHEHAPSAPSQARVILYADMRWRNGTDAAHGPLRRARDASLLSHRTQVRPARAHS